MAGRLAFPRSFLLSSMYPTRLQHISGTREYEYAPGPGRYHMF